MLLDSHSLNTVPWSETVLEGSVGSCGAHGQPEEQGWGSRQRVRVRKSPPALARVWLSKKLSPYNQDPKEFSAMLLPCPWAVLGHSRSCGPSGGACQPTFPCKACVCHRAPSGGAPGSPWCPTHPLWVSAHQPDPEPGFESASTKRNAGHIPGLGSRESDIWEFTSEISDLRCEPGWTPAEEHPWHPLGDPLWPPAFRQN